MEPAAWRRGRHARLDAARSDAQQRDGQAQLEPWVDGEALSLSLLCADGGAETLAVNRQRIVVGGDGMVSYEGVDVAAVPPADPRTAALRQVGMRVALALPGLRGYVGIDLVWHARRGPVLIEINPRVTCAYVGLSAALGRPLAAEILALFAGPIGAAMRAAELPGPHADAGVIGWDLGGAHVKACLLMEGTVREVVQWPCPLWQGLDRLDTVLEQAAARWPHMRGSLHAVTMTGEMTDLFQHREEGVLRLAQRMADLPGRALAFYAGDRGWCRPDEVATTWSSIASANWLAAARLAARRLGDGVLVDIGSTTCDLIPLQGGAVAARGAPTRTASPAANWSTRAWCARRCARSRGGSPFAARPTT